MVLCLTCAESLARKEFAKHGLHLFSKAEIEALVLQAGFGPACVLRAADKHREFLCLQASKA